MASRVLYLIVSGAAAAESVTELVLACQAQGWRVAVNKFAHGHADNFALALLCEMAGYGSPMVVVPYCQAELARHPAFGASLQTLAGMGVRVLFDPDAPADRRLPPWREVLAALPAAPAG